MSWTVRFTAEAERQAEALDPPVRRRIAARLAQLADNPKTAANIKVLAGGGDRYRLRVGDWRIIYTLQDEVLTVLVLRVGHRRDIYR